MISSFQERVYLKNNYTSIPGYESLESVDVAFFDLFQKYDRDLGFDQVAKFSNQNDPDDST